MRIETDQFIAGLTARKVRQFMRQAAGRLISPRTVTEVLGFSEAEAIQLLAELQKEGLVTAKAEYWEATARGHALAMATAAKPLRRATAEKLIVQIVERAQKINREKAFAYRVQLLIAFGSYVAGAERPNDVDVGCSLIARFDGSKQRALENQRRRNKGRFTNTSEWALWPKLEVLKALKSGARGLSVQEVGGWDLKKIDHVVIFSDKEALRTPVEGEW